MPNNPVQVILNDEAFITSADGKRSGPRKEFYKQNDGSFARHKQSIRTQVDQIAVELSSAKFEESGIVRVKLQEDALAKSHRPTRALFKPDQLPCVGAGGLGELFFFASRKRLNSLIEAIDSAEEVSTQKTNANNRPYFSPSDARSDLGALNKVEIVSSAEKRTFDVDTALSQIADPRSVGGYLVELFPMPRLRDSRPLPEFEPLLESLRGLLMSMGSGTRARMVRPSRAVPPLLEVTLDKSDSPPEVLLPSTEGTLTAAGGERGTELDLSRERNEQLLTSLAEHPLVRRISLPFRLILNDEITTRLSGVSWTAPEKTPGVEYPRVGLIDNGVAGHLSAWIIHKHDFLKDEEVELEHGTFIAGLLTSGQALNSPMICAEPDGCEIVDVPLYPKARFRNYYRGDFRSFLEEVENAVSEAVADHGVRVFNLSINVLQSVDSDSYSYFAGRLDDISDQYGVIFVNSVGNLSNSEYRSPWPKQAKDALAYFANRTNADTIYKPSESARSMSVGAINPHGCNPHFAGAPTTYTRRGPGLRVGQKPDLAHYGGSEATGDPPQHGLRSVTVDGSVVEGAGTSFAAPLIAKTLATIDARTSYVLRPDALRAFVIHNADIPEILNNPRLRELARQFVGFGVPMGSDSMLETDDSAITLVFNSVLPAAIRNRPQVLRFPFTWPPSLVTNESGACTGYVRMTLIYDAPLDPRFGTEVVRVNLDAHLRQRIEGYTKRGKPKFQNRIPQCFLPKTDGRPAFERELINHGLKWWPVKRYEKFLPAQGVGVSSDWVLEVDSVVRAEANFPETGIPFTLLVTIQDTDGSRPVFQEVRRSIQAGRAKLQDIRVTSRVQTRA